MDLNKFETLQLFHEEGMMALRGERKNHQPRKRLQMMDKMPKELRKLDMFRETFILNAVLGKSRPAAANKQMSFLRNSRQTAGNLEKYTEFEANLELHLDGVTFGPHGYRTRRLGDANVDEVFAGIHNLIDVLKAIGYDAFANAGTLLGLVREKGLVPHDDDIDLAVILKERRDYKVAAEFKALAEKLRAKGLECHLIKGRNAIIKLPDIAGFEVDLFPAYGWPNAYNIYPYARKTLDFSDISPLKSCPVSGLPLPAKPEVVLEVNYGENWRIPDPRYTLKWVPMKKRFAGLLDSLEEIE